MSRGGTSTWAASVPRSTPQQRHHPSSPSSCLLPAAAADYYTLHGNASLGGCVASQWGNTLAQWRAQPGYSAFEANSTAATLPTATTVIQWGRDVLGL